MIHFNRVFHYKPSILGYPYFWKHPYLVRRCLLLARNWLMIHQQLEARLFRNHLFGCQKAQEGLCSRCLTPKIYMKTPKKWAMVWFRSFSCSNRWKSQLPAVCCRKLVENKWISSRFSDSNFGRLRPTYFWRSTDPRKRDYYWSHL